MIPLETAVVMFGSLITVDVFGTVWEGDGLIFRKKRVVVGTFSAGLDRSAPSSGVRKRPSKVARSIYRKPQTTGVAGSRKRKLAEEQGVRDTESTKRINDGGLIGLLEGIRSKWDPHGSLKNGDWDRLIAMQRKKVELSEIEFARSMVDKSGGAEAEQERGLDRSQYRHDGGSGFVDVLDEWRSPSDLGALAPECFLSSGGGVGGCGVMDIGFSAASMDLITDSSLVTTGFDGLGAMDFSFPFPLSPSLLVADAALTYPAAVEVA